MIDTTNMSIMANLITPNSNIMSSQMISQKDSDSDASLSSSEMGIDSELFSSYDLDANGLMSQSELSTAIDTAMSGFNGKMPSKEEFQSVLSDFGFEAQNSSSGLSSSQQATISSVLEEYDSKNLSQSDALEIVSAFKEAGIQPRAQLESAMEEAGFDANEVGTLAQVESKENTQNGASSGGSGGNSGGGGGGGSDSSEEEYDAMDTNEDGVVSASEYAEYYGLSDDSTDGESSNEQNALDNLSVLMNMLKSDSEEGAVNPNSFDGLLKAINNQNNNSEINTYLENTQTSSLFGYA
jgi:hypothetical protein